MAKSPLYRLCGVGRIPAQVMSQLQGEGIVLCDEGVKSSVTYRNFSAPGKRFGWKRQWFPASIALTKTRLLALWYSNLIIDVPLSDERIRALHFSLESSGRLCVAFDAALFHPDWAGTIEYRFRTAEASRFLDSLHRQIV